MFGQELDQGTKYSFSNGGSGRYCGDQEIDDEQTMIFTRGKPLTDKITLTLIPRARAVLADGNSIISDRIDEVQTTRSDILSKIAANQISGVTA
ncbi:MAG: hypothetical protein ABIG28_03445 [archaeon]